MNILCYYHNYEELQIDNKQMGRLEQACTQADMQAGKGIRIANVLYLFKSFTRIIKNYFHYT